MAVARIVMDMGRIEILVFRSALGTAVTGKREARAVFRDNGAASCARLRIAAESVGHTNRIPPQRPVSHSSAAHLRLSSI